MEKASKQLHQILSLRPNPTQEEARFLDFYNNKKETESLLILEKDAFQNLEATLQGHFILDKSVYKSVLEYAFTQSMTNFDIIHLYVFSLIKDYTKANSSIIDADPFAPCYINYDKLSKFLKIDQLPVEKQYEYLHQVMNDIQQITLEITIIPYNHLTLNVDRSYSIALIENFTFPDLNEFTAAIQSKEINSKIGFRFNNLLSDVVEFCIYDSFQLEVGGFAEPTTNFS